MAIPAGWAEFNDATAVIRGRIVAATGTFSGTFSADNVEAVKEMNIRNGAVSAYYGFSFAAGAKDITFTIPAQPIAPLADIVVPLVVQAVGIGAQGRVDLYRNDALVWSEYVQLDTESTYIFRNDFYNNENLTIAQVVRFIDFNMNVSTPTTYRIVLTDGTFQAPNPANGQGFMTLYFSGTATVGCRKR